MELEIFFTQDILKSAYVKSPLAENFSTTYNWVDQAGQ